MLQQLLSDPAAFQAELALIRSDQGLQRAIGIRLAEDLASLLEGSADLPPDTVCWFLDTLTSVVRHFGQLAFASTLVTMEQARLESLVRAAAALVRGRHSPALMQAAARAWYTQADLLCMSVQPHLCRDAQRQQRAVRAVLETIASLGAAAGAVLSEAMAGSSPGLTQVSCHSSNCLLRGSERG